MNRQQRRRSCKFQGMSFADKIAREKRLREAAQLAASDLAVQIKADIHTQKTVWLLMLCLNEGWKFGEKSFQKLAALLTQKSKWYEDMVKENDEDYAEEKLRQEAERVTREKIEFAWEKEMQAARKRHENDTITQYEQFRLYQPQRMAETLCSWLECQNCPGRELCSHKDGKANGLVKWFEQEVDKNA